MKTYDSTVKRADRVRPGDVIVGVSASGEALREVAEVFPCGPEVLLTVTGRELPVRLGRRDLVRVAHPDTY